MLVKTCSCCGAEKPLNMFQIRATSKDGYTASCKTCLKERDRVRDQNPDRIASKKEYAQGKGKEIANACKRRWQEKNPKKRSVHVTTGNAIRDGLIQKGCCQVCGSEDVVAHHCDYDKPLDVTWLCPKHHEKWHNDHGEGLNAT